MKSDRIEILCGSLTLEGLAAYPQGTGPFALIVICHPHSLYGGSMYNHVIEAVAQKAIQKGLASLRFNFRGVGRSGGRFGDGIGEQEDLRAVLSYAEDLKTIDRKKIGVCGYSFGSRVALAVAAEDPRIAAVAAISPFIEPPDLLDCYRRPKLFVSGSDDEWVDPMRLKAKVEGLPEPKECIIFPGVDHFWLRALAPMADRVVQFFLDHFAKAPSGDSP